MITRNEVNYDIIYSEICKVKQTYVDNSGYNSPDLLDTMVPIRYYGTN